MEVLMLLSLVVVVTSQEKPYTPIVFPEEPGLECQLDNGQPGMCRDIYSCPVVGNKVREERPLHCGFEASTPIVCCPIDEGSSEPLPAIDNISPSSEPLPAIDNISPSSETVPAIDNISPSPEPLPDAVIRINNISPSSEQVPAIDNISPPSETVPAIDNVSPPTIDFECGDSVALGVIEPNTTVTTRLYQAKYMALVGNRDADGNVEWFCGGVLINKRWVLTGAHCFDKRTTNVVRLGEYDYLDDLDGNFHEDISVARMVQHPDYTFPQAYHDLALIQLAKDIDVNIHINPVCLPWGQEADRNLESEAVTLTGWGATEFGGLVNTIMKEVNVTVFPSSRCDQSYSRLQGYSKNWPEGIAEESLCAANTEGGIDSCEGDGGSPVAYLDARDRFTLAGVVSRGHSCGLEEFPTLYVNVRRATYLAWIKSVAFDDKR